MEIHKMNGMKVVMLLVFSFALLFNFISICIVIYLLNFSYNSVWLCLNMIVFCTQWLNRAQMSRIKILKS